MVTMNSFGTKSMFSKKLVPFLVFVLMLGNVSIAHSAVINAYQIFMHAQRGNRQFFEVLSRYENAIDLRTKNGYTAYCLAMLSDDENAMFMLRRYGANTRHQCVKKIEEAKKNNWNEDDFYAQNKFKVAPATSNTALLTGLGVVAVGGGVALASGGGGGSGDSGKPIDNKTPDKNITPDKNGSDNKTKKNYILAKGSGNNVKFSDGYKGFRLDYSKHPANSGDEFKHASTSKASNSNTLKLAVIECYKQDCAGQIGKIMERSIPT